VLRIIRELIEFHPKSKKTNIGEALKYLSNVIKKKAIVFVLSDFVDTGYEETMKIVGKKHDVTGIRVYDLHDEIMPNLGLVPMLDAENMQTILVNTASKKVRSRYNAHYLELVANFQQSFQKSGAGTINVRTDENYVKKLLVYFKQKS